MKNLEGFCNKHFLPAAMRLFESNAPAVAALWRHQMRRPERIAVQLAAISLVAAVTQARGDQQQPAAMPEVIFDHREYSKAYQSVLGKKRAQIPLWVDKAVAFDQRGELDPAMFVPAAYDFIVDRLEQLPKGESGCVDLSLSLTAESEESAVDVANSILRSEWIFTGRVTGLSQGFRGAVPGSLVRIEAERVLLGELPQAHPHRR